jgi:hypothetical protein
MIDFAILLGGIAACSKFEIVVVIGDTVGDTANGRFQHSWMSPTCHKTQNLSTMKQMKMTALLATTGALGYDERKRNTAAAVVA